MRNWNILLIIIVVLLATHGQATALTVWPDTGQDKCYDNFWPITCPQKGQSFYGQDAQYHGQQPSYTKLDTNASALPESAETWAMVQDNVTALTWEVKTDDDTIHDKENKYYWCNSSLENSGRCEEENNTEAFVKALNSAKFGGYDDWRLPVISELITLVDSSTHNPAIDTVFFPNTLPTSVSINVNYWSSTVKAGNSYSRWFVDFRKGGKHAYVNTFFDSSVRAVRGGGSGSPNKYKNNQNGTITDIDTGLMWQQDPSYEVKGVSGLDYLTWEDALAYVADLNLISFAGHADWRLPSRNEFLSLIDYSRERPAFNTDYFKDASIDYYFYYYWTSTTEHRINGYAWIVNFGPGTSTGWPKTAGGNVRAVRTNAVFKLLVPVYLLLLNSM